MNQMLDFLLNKEEQRLPCRYYNYLFQKPHRRSNMEKHFLKEKVSKLEMVMKAMKKMN